MCNFIGWNIANGNCTSWGNHAGSVSKQYNDLWHSTYNVLYDWTHETTTVSKSSGTYWLFPTGMFVSSAEKDTSQKNIYDVAGNVWEWTTEEPLNASGTSTPHSVARGGSADYNGISFPASNRQGNCPSDYRTWRIGFRLVLYVAKP